MAELSNSGSGSNGTGDNNNNLGAVLPPLPPHSDYDDVIYVQEDSEDLSEDEEEEEEEEADGDDEGQDQPGDHEEEEEEDGFVDELRRSREAFFNHASITRSFLANRKSVKVCLFVLSVKAY